jgi:rRNA-processing protein FCF1
MNEYLLKLIQNYKQKGLLIDTNILLLYIVGSVDINLIGNFKRTANFTISDFYITSKFIDYFDIKITTPHILTEASDLLGNRIDLQFALAKYIKLIEEKFLESNQIAETKTFLQFGLADAAISETAKDSYLVVTDDNPLYAYLINQKIDAISLNQIRMI